MSSSENSTQRFEEGEELFSAPSVEVYKIVNNTKQLICKDTLSVILVRDDEGQFVCFLSIEKQQAPLFSNIPCLRMDKWDYVFPMPNSFFGLTFPRYIPSSDLEAFEKILEQYCDYKVTASQESVVQTSDKSVTTMKSTGSVLEKGSQFVGVTLVKGACLVSRGFTSGGRYLQSMLTPNEKPVSVSAKTKGRVAKTRHMTGAAVKVSSSMVKGVTDVANAIAASLSQAVVEADIPTKLGMKKSDGPNERLQAGKDLALSGLSAVSNIYEAMYDAGEILLKGAATTTTTLVEHKYGQEAGDVSREVMHSAHDVVQSSRNISSLGTKSLLKKTAKQTGTNILTTSSTTSTTTTQSSLTITEHTE